jgi:hypothetical protein
VDARVVEGAAVGILRLCQRLLPYKPDVAEPLLRGLQVGRRGGALVWVGCRGAPRKLPVCQVCQWRWIKAFATLNIPTPLTLQLVPSLDPEMAWQNAEKIAAEMLALVKGCALHIQHQWAWAGVCNLLKMTAIRWGAWPACCRMLLPCCCHPCCTVIGIAAAICPAPPVCPPPHLHTRTRTRTHTGTRTRTHARTHVAHVAHLPRRPEAFPTSFEALQWVVNECLTPLNYLLAMEACGWFVERAALEHTERKDDALALVTQLELWLQAWGDQVSRDVPAAEVGAAG